MEILRQSIASTRLQVRNPYNNKLIETIQCDSRESVARAIDQAGIYNFSLTCYDRFEILQRLCQLLEQHREALAQLISMESGKPLRDAHIEVTRACQAFLLSAEESKRINGELLPLDAVPDTEPAMAMVVREPLGIVAAVTPFNFPLNLVAHKVGPALAANNPVIVKPSESTPLTAIRLMELLYEAGLPPELMQVVIGDPAEIVDVLCSDDRIKKISFTGSTEVGKRICHLAGMKQVCMELGGSDPMVILSDADLDAALPVAIDDVMDAPTSASQCAKLI